MAKVNVRNARGRVTSKGKKPPQDGVTKPKVPAKTSFQKRLGKKK